MSKRWRYTKRIPVEHKEAEEQFLARLGVAPKITYKRARSKGKDKPGLISHAVFTVVAERPIEALPARNYREVVRASTNEKPGPATPDGVVTSEAELVEMGLSRTLARELVHNEWRCRKSLGMRARKRENRIGGGVRPGQRRGSAIEVFGTCSYCLTAVPRRWRFNTVEWKNTPLFLCEGCIERARGRASRTGASDAMHRAVYRKRSRG